MQRVWASLLQTIGLTHAASTNQAPKQAQSDDADVSYQFSADQSFLSGTTQFINPSRSNQATTPQLLNILFDGSFFGKVGGEWKLDFRKDVLPIIKEDFKHELPRLKRARADRRGIPKQRPNSFGVLLYGKEDGEEKAMTYYELDRTLTAVQSLRWIKDGKRENFNEDISQDSWEWIIARFNEVDAKVFEKEYAEECFALITSVIINDLGKDPELARDYRKIRPQEEDISTDNHDMQLDKAIKAGMVPCLEWLRPDLKDDILLGIHVSAECNLGQLAQAEDVPASLYPLLRFRNHRRAWHFRFMEQIVDLAGARGHFDNTRAVVFRESVARGNRSAHTVAEGIIWNNVSVTSGYNSVLLQRYTILRSHGYPTELSITHPPHRALMRLFCLAGASDPSVATLLENSLLSSPLTAPFRAKLIDALNASGSSRPAIQITYAPAMCAGALAHPWPEDRDSRAGIRAVASILRFMARCYDVPEQDLHRWRAEGVTVLERDVFGVVDGYVKTDAFFENPDGLDAWQVPGLVVANRREEACRL